MPDKNSVVATYDNHADAEACVKLLEKAKFDLTKLSIVARNEQIEDTVTGFYNTSDRMKHWGKMGAFWGGIWGMLVGAAFFVIPGIGSVVIAGPLVAALVAGLQGAVVVGGLSALGAGLVSLGIPKDSAVDYETALKADKFLVIAHGSAQEVDRAQDIIETTRASKVAVHHEEPVPVA